MTHSLAPAQALGSQGYAYTWQPTNCHTSPASLYAVLDRQRRKFHLQELNKEGMMQIRKPGPFTDYLTAQ